MRDYRQIKEPQINFLRNYSQRIRNGDLRTQTLCNGKAIIFDMVLAYKLFDFVTVDFHMEATRELSHLEKTEVEQYLTYVWIPNYVGETVPCRVYWVRVKNGVKNYDF